jgi:non-ribosomal peptide synthetase component E (peptide arylation enzyme)
MQSWIHVIEWRANVRPDLTALVDDRGAAYTYAQLRAETERKAGGWAGLRIGPGDVVAIVAKNSAAFLVHAFALMRAGATPAFVNWRLSGRELTEVLTLVEPKAIAADADFAIEIGDQVAGSHHLQILPLFHLGGFGQCMQAILTAGTVYIHTAFNPAAVIDAIEADGRITRIEEYLDSARRSEIRKAREALSG